jgi:23S rRNA (cytidine1920-2'-O)/16S rRNA (cytidine1409-2'-O)-methyltransferase
VPRKRLDVLLVERGLAESRAQAQALVLAGRVAGYEKAGQQVDESAELTVSEAPRFVSRGGEKLAHALDALRLDPSGTDALDVGASTGGFTDVLLRGGATQVLCLDVGHDQLVPWLRDDPRTVVLEGRNIRDVTLADLGGTVDLVVADVSFISLVLVLPVLTGLVDPEARPPADLLLMVKPQFEVGRERLGSGGVVRRPDLRADAVRRVAEAGQGLGWGAHGILRSPLPGPSGNLEYFLWLRRGPGTLTADAVDRAVAGGASGERVSS